MASDDVATSPDVKSAASMSCAVVRAADGRALLGGKAGLGLSLELRLPGGLLGLKLLDLALDPGAHPLALGELVLDPLLLARPLGDDLGLLRPGALQRRPPRFHFLAEPLYLLEHLRVLVADALHHVEAPEEVVEVLGTEEDLDGAAAVAVDVERPQPVRDVHLCRAEALLGDDEVMRVRLEIGVDLPELDVRVVVRLDRPFELHVRLLDLRQDCLCLGALRVDRGIRRRRRNESQQKREERPRGKDDGRSLSRSRTVHKAWFDRRKACRSRQYPSEARIVAAAVVGCNRQPYKIPANQPFHSR